MVKLPDGPKLAKTLKNGPTLPEMTSAEIEKQLVNLSSKDEDLQKQAAILLNAFITSPRFNNLNQNLLDKLIKGLIEGVRDKVQAVRVNSQYALRDLAESGISNPLKTMMITRLIVDLKAETNGDRLGGYNFILYGIAVSEKAPVTIKEHMARSLIDLCNKKVNISRAFSPLTGLITDSSISKEYKKQIVDIIITALRAGSENVRNDAASAVVTIIPSLSRANKEKLAPLIIDNIKTMAGESVDFQRRIAQALHVLARSTISADLKAEISKAANNYFNANQAKMDSEVAYNIVNVIENLP